MMRRIRRLVAYGAATGLLVAGAVSVSMEVAHASFSLPCNGNSGDSYTCNLTRTYIWPVALSVQVTDTASTPTSENVTVSWGTSGISCTNNNNGTQTEPAGADAGATPFTGALPLPAAATDGRCTVSVTITVSPASAQSNPSTFVPTPFSAVLDYTPSGTATPTPTPTASSTSPAAGPPVHPIKGFDGKCVSDKGNSSANRTKIIIWTCSGTDQAENWKFSNNEFIHNGKCLNDQGNGGIRSKVILWTCNGGSNEKWSELANGELKLQSHGGTLCLDDPRSSTSNGTQLIVYTCQGSSNQKWKQPRQPVS
jgi:Ricin-type beta-trefoil lectin domain